MVTVGQVLTPMFSRGSLPHQVRVAVSFGAAPAGAVLTWSDEKRCYVTADGRWCVLASLVREEYGARFLETRAAA